MSLTELLAAAEAERRGERLNDRGSHALTSPESGLPFPCKECGGHGFLDRIDLFAHVQHEHCRNCGNHWSRPI